MSTRFTAAGLSGPVFFRLRTRQNLLRSKRPTLAGMLATALAFSLIPQLAATQAMLLPTTELQVGPHAVSAEVAATPASRAHGLMGRKSLPENHGMLFVFDMAQRHCFWMKNTPLPLSIAFIDSDGRVVNIADMHPHSEQSHCPAEPVRFALEMAQGWFAGHGIQAGAKVSGLPRP